MGPFHETYTSCPLGDVVISGLSVHETCPLGRTGSVHVCPWSIDLMNKVEKPPWRSAFRKNAYTIPVSGTTVIVGSYCALLPLTPQMGTWSPQLAPLFDETVNVM